MSKNKQIINGHNIVSKTMNEQINQAIKFLENHHAFIKAETESQQIFDEWKQVSKKAWNMQKMHEILSQAFKSEKFALLFLDAVWGKGYQVRSSSPACLSNGDKDPITQFLYQPGNDLVVQAILKIKDNYEALIASFNDYVEGQYQAALNDLSNGMKQLSQNQDVHSQQRLEYAKTIKFNVEECMKDPKSEITRAHATQALRLSSQLVKNKNDETNSISARVDSNDFNHIISPFITAKKNSNAKKAGIAMFGLSMFTIALAPISFFAVAPAIAFLMSAALILGAVSVISSSVHNSENDKNNQLQHARSLINGKNNQPQHASSFIKDKNIKYQKQQLTCFFNQLTEKCNTQQNPVLDKELDNFAAPKVRLKG